MRPITKEESFNLRQRLKPSVSDFYSVTPQHYNYAGPVGWEFFRSLLNALILDMANFTISGINRTYACILFKGHNKDKESSRSYRTISTCPVVAKALDLFVRDECINLWNQAQSSTQFQGTGSSHELAALLLTECVQHSLYSLKRPMFALYLDARSAFDVVLREILIRNLYHANTPGKLLVYINND